jgi:hypothetical protein
MDLTKVLAQLRLELEHVDSAILSLVRLQAGSGPGHLPRPLLDVRELKAAARRTSPPKRRAERGRPGNG